MNKIKNILIVIIMMMFVSIVDVDAAGVTIKSIKLIDHTGSATEISEPKVSGLNINFDLAFAALNDSATYEVVLNNPTNKEYEINTDKKFGPSNYISYTYELKDKTNRIKANSEVTLNIIIKYEHAVPPSELVNGQYVENNDLGITLLNEENPSTANNLILIAIILLISLGLTLIMKKSKRKNQLIVLIALLLVPVTVFALEKLTLTVTTKIIVGEMYDVYYQKTFVKESELNNGEYYYDNCDTTYRVEQEDGSYVNYKVCTYLFKKEPRKYVPGERVTVHSNDILEVKNLDDCVITDGLYGSHKPSEMIREKRNNGPSIGNMSFTCVKNALQTFNFTEFKYQCLYNLDETPVSGTCSSNDMSVMNFKSIDFNNWDIPENQYIKFKSPNEFTMPKHDVFISNDYLVAGN